MPTGRKLSPVSYDLTVQSQMSAMDLPSSLLSQKASTYKTPANRIIAIDCDSTTILPPEALELLSNHGYILQISTFASNSFPEVHTDGAK